MSLTPELERLINEKVESGLYQTASAVVREALRLLNDRDVAREQLRADVQAGCTQLMRDGGVVYSGESGPSIAEKIEAERPQEALDGPLMPYRLSEWLGAHPSAGRMRSDVREASMYGVSGGSS